MESISDRQLDELLAIEDGRHFLTAVVEPLGDAFDPQLAREYETLFSRVIRRAAPHLIPRLRPAPRNAWPSSAEKIYILSRVTLGADIAITSVLIDAAKRRYPNARLLFVGARKNFELFEADPRLEHWAAPYARDGSLAARLDQSAALWFDDGVVIDPDSRFSQLGLIRVCPDEHYLFFDSRSIGGDSLDRLPNLAARWAGDPLAKPYIAPQAAEGEAPDITVSLGVGENLNKRLDDAFELGLMQTLAATGRGILVDLGGSPEERARVERVLQPGMRAHSGAFAPFAAQIARSKLFVGYDSAAGHAASACGIPLISIARGFVNDRMAARWRPLGTVIDARQPGGALAAVQAALDLSFPSGFAPRSR